MAWRVRTGVTVAGLLVTTAGALHGQTGAPAAPAQGKIVALNGRVEHTPPLREAWGAAQVAWRDLPAASSSGAAGAGFERLRAGDAPGALAVFQANPADV